MKTNFVLVFVSLFSYLILSLVILDYPQGLEWERSILVSTHNLNNSLLDWLAYLITNLGNWWFVLLLSMVFAIYFLLKKQPIISLYILVSMLGADLIMYTTKLFFKRPRPQLLDFSYSIASGYSFPSGHALMSMAFALTLVSIFWARSWRNWLAILTIGSAVIIAGTRLYLGVHFPSDIIGGWLLAIAWTVTAYTLVIVTLKNSDSYGRITASTDKIDNTDP
jgi:undecaprenyl-diphosphatase